MFSAFISLLSDSGYCTTFYFATLIVLHIRILLETKKFVFPVSLVLKLVLFLECFLAYNCPWFSQWAWMYLFFFQFIYRGGAKHVQPIRPHETLQYDFLH